MMKNTKKTKGTSRVIDSRKVRSLAKKLGVKFTRIGTGKHWTIGLRGENARALADLLIKSLPLVEVEMVGAGSALLPDIELAVRS